MAADSIRGQIPAMMATLASYEGMFGPYHPQTLAVTTALGIALCQAGRRQEGRPFLQRALLDLTKHHSPRHPLRVRALEAWCEVLRQDGDSRAALVIQRELSECGGEAICGDAIS
jgi:hypothetical protein